MFVFETGFHKDPEVYRFVVQDGVAHPVNTKAEIALVAGKRPRPDAIAVWSVAPGTKVELDYEGVHSNGTFYGWLVWEEPKKPQTPWM